MATSAELEPKVKNNEDLCSRSYGGELEGGGDNDDTEDEDCDVEALDTLSNSFTQAQSVLDQNQSLIEQVNENHQSMLPEKLNKNVSLISEINRNISKVISIYSDLSVNFSNMVQERRHIDNGNNVEKTGA